MSLYNKASLIQVPSLYKDGLLVSTVPEDRSGDFTVARGSNLSATRIGEDGYIKKGYENLLLQSNSFLTSPWQLQNGADITPNHSGYDGSNDAWYLYKDTGTSSQTIRQPIVSTGVQTFSFYAKAEELEWVRFLYTGSSSGRSHFHLVGDGATGTLINTISASIELIGNGWYKCSTTFDATTDRVYIYPSISDNNVSGSTGGLYIQDAQLNQGLVAYTYLETTDAPAQGGLLENSPRLDWSNGVPAVLVEESRTNIVEYSEAFSRWNSNLNSPVVADNFATSPEGLTNAAKITFPTNNDGVADVFSIGATGNNLVFSIYVKNIDATFTKIQIRNSITDFESQVNWTDSTITSVTTIDGTLEYEAVGNDWYRIWGAYVNDDPNVRPRLYSNGSNASYLVYGAQLEQGSTPSSYIPTYGTSQTRSNETVSDTFSIPTTATIYNSFYAPASEQVYVLDQVFSVSEGLNKVAIAFSPTAIKISVGGAIVASSTGSYDTTSLTSISLGSDSGADYSNAPISGFYIFPEFLTDLELNSLTA